MNASPVADSSGVRSRQFKVSAGVQARLARLAQKAENDGVWGNCSNGVCTGLRIATSSAEAAVDGGTSNISQQVAAGWVSDESVCGEPAILSEGEEDNTADSKERCDRQPIRLELTPPFEEIQEGSPLAWRREVLYHRHALMAMHKQAQARKRLY
jgi:hypothetical protein